MSRPTLTKSVSEKNNDNFLSLLDSKVSSGTQSKDSSNRLLPTVSRTTTISTSYKDSLSLTKTNTHSGHGFTQTYTNHSASYKIPDYKTVQLKNPDIHLRPASPKSITEADFFDISRGRKTSKCNDLSVKLKPSKSDLTAAPLSAPTKLQFKTPTSANSLDTYSTRVSFDTVNVQYIDDSDDYDSDDGLDRNFSFRPGARSQFLETGGWGPEAKRNTLSPTPPSSRGRAPERMLSPSSSHERLLSPGAETRMKSPARSISPGKLRSPSRHRMEKDPDRKYPTMPIITHDACTLTYKHKLFDDLYENKVPNKTAKLSRRSIMVYISGRQHTWVALDWCCNRLLEDGDSLIVIASTMPSSQIRRRRSSGSFTASESHLRKTPQYVRVVTDSIMKYILAIVNPNKIIKITIELGVGHTKDVLKDMYSLYLPSLVVTSAKPTRAMSAKAWVTSRITDRLVKNFPVPLIVVPALNMGHFETKLFETLNRKNKLLQDGHINSQDSEYHYDHDNQYHNDHDLRERLGLNQNKKIADKLGLNHLIDSDNEEEPNGDDADNEDEDDEDEDEEDDFDELASIYTDSRHSANTAYSTDSITKIREATVEANAKLYSELRAINKRPVDKNTFKDKLDSISKAGYQVGIKLADTAKSGGQGAKLVRTITGAPDPPSVKRSMLLDDPPAPPVLKVTTSRSKSPPSANAFIGVSGAHRSSTSLKFETDLPKQKHGAGIDSTLGYSLNPSRSNNSMTNTRKTRPQLQTSKSSSEIEKISKKKSGGLFKKFFGKGN